MMGEAKEWVQNGIRRCRESGPPEKLRCGWSPPSFSPSRPGVGPENPYFSQVPRSWDAAGWEPTTTSGHASSFIYTSQHHRWHLTVVYGMYLAISLLTLVLISSSSTALAQSEHLERGLGPSGVVKLQNNEKAHSNHDTTFSVLSNHTSGNFLRLFGECQQNGLQSNPLH